MVDQIYWQKQGIERMCGVHSLNNLLQGPFFDEVGLAQIALEFDERERELIDKDLQVGLEDNPHEESGNVANDGYYSIQVLVEALNGMHLTMTVLTSFKTEEMLNQTGFICHSKDHWFAIRKIDNIWYNLNSTYKSAPVIISDGDVTPFLEAQKKAGCQIFTVQGQYPESSRQRFNSYNNNQIWVEKTKLFSNYQRHKKSKETKLKKGINLPKIWKQDQVHLDLKSGDLVFRSGRVIKKKSQSSQSEQENDDWNDSKQSKNTKKKRINRDNHGKRKKHKQSISKKQKTIQLVNYDKFNYAQEQVEVIQFLKQHLEDQFEKEPSEGKLVTFLMKKEQIHRIFPNDCLIQSLYDYIWIKKGPNSKFVLVDDHSKQELRELSIQIFVLESENGQIVVSVNDL